MMRLMGLFFGALGLSLGGCAQATTRMRVGEPLEVNQGACFVHTSYAQDGKELNWDDTTRKLSRFESSQSYMSAGNTWAIGSIAAAVAATPAVLAGSWGKRDLIEMDDDVSTGLLVSGIVVGVAGIAMCVTSDAEYAGGGRAYNESLKSKPGGDDNKPYDDDE